MDRKFILLVTSFLVLGAILLYRGTLQGSAQVLMPAELLERGSDVTLSRIRVAGRVAEKPIEYSGREPFVLKFQLADPVNASSLVPVIYQNLKPDMFSEGRDVIIDGEYRGGVLHASKLLTQCPSKYEPPDPASLSKKKSRE